MSRVDEEVMENYQNNVELVTLESGEAHLQFKLPWSRNPVIKKDNYGQAKSVLLRLRDKLRSQLELRSKN